MNMISTGSFLTETGASNKQSELVKKLTAAWEKKNSKTARAGGASLMALSLAACGGEDNTPFSQADVDAAKVEGAASVDITSDNTDVMLAQADYDAAIAAATTSNDADIAAAAKTEALTAANGTIYATVDAAYTAGSNVSNADAVTAALTGADGTVYATVDAAVTAGADSVDITTDNQAAIDAEMDGTGFADVASLLAAYNDAIAATPALNTALTTADESVFGTAGDDAITGTATTFTAGDIITDGSSSDNDTLTITTTTDISATPVVSGIENINIVLTSVAGGATGGDTLTVDVADIASGTITGSATNASTIVTTFDVDNVQTGVTIASDIATINVADTDGDADLTIAHTGATGAIVHDGASDTLTITGGNLTVNTVDAEDSVTITATGTVSMDDTAANGAGTDVAYSITAGDDVSVTDIQDTGSLEITATGGDVVIGDGTSAIAIDGAVTVTTSAGDITITEADLAAGALTLTAVGAGPLDTTTASDGAIIVTTADAATSAVLTSTDSITITSLAAATDVTLSAAANSGITDVDAIENLTLSSTSTAATPIEFTMTSTDGQTLETVTFTGDNDVTFNMAAADLVAAATASQALVATDNSSGTSRIAITTNAAGAGLDMSGAAVDEIEVAFNQGTNALTFASGANVIASANQTDLTVTAAAVAGNSLNLTLDSGTVGTGVDLDDLSATNFASIAVTMADDATASHNIDLLGVGASTTMTISGNGGLSFGTIGTAQTVSSVDASGVSGDITAAVVMTGSFKSGSGDDSISISDANAAGIGNNRNIDGGDGADSLIFAANDDFSAATLTLANIETLNVAASGITVSGAQVSGKGYNFVGDNTGDTLAIDSQIGTGETINISTSEIVLATVTITGGAGADTLTGSATSATTINGGDAADTIVGGAGDDLLSGNDGDDTLTGGDGSDTFFIDLFSANGSDTITDFVKADDDIDLDVAVTGSTISGEEAVAAKAAVASTADDELYVFADATQDITGTAGSGIADFTDLADVASFLDTAITAVDTHEYLAILNDAAGTTAYVFHIDEAAENDADDDITSGDLTLLATITTDAAITTGETIIA